MFAHLEESTQYLLQEIFLFALQLSLFIMIPLLWYIVSHKKVRNFLAYIGIKKAPVKSFISAFAVTGVGYTFTIAYFICLKLSGGMEISPLQKACEISNTITFCCVALVYALNAGVCEEILFRGFIGKRCIDKYGFKAGNLIQALIFTFPHLVTFGTSPTLEVLLGIINAGLMGYVFGYIMDKKADGSIVPSVVVHTVVDLIAVPISLFVL